jgi:hypothetical protein
LTCLALESLNFLAMEHVDVFIAADIVALHLILILVLIVCLRIGSGVQGCVWGAR